METKKILKSWLIVIIAIVLMNNFTIAQQLQMSSPNVNGFNIACFGQSSGSIDLTISGGTSPYTILWSNNATSEDLANVPAGYYRVTVDDADTTTNPVSAEITLTEPRQLRLDILSYKYPNNFNISLYGACNGSITLTPTDGVSPYTYAWTDGNTNQNRTAACAGKYKITLTDVNGCSFRSDEVVLTQPERSDWQMSGNANTNPASQFLGTSDNSDLVFKTNNVESFRIKANGQVDFVGNVKFNNSIDIGGNNLIGFRAPTAGIPPIISFGSNPNTNPFTLTPCIAPDPTRSTYQFNGLIQSWGIPAGGIYYNTMQMGFDGINCVIDAMGNSPDPNGNRLLINYNCGRDVFIGNGALGGNLTVSNNLYTLGNVGIGNSSPNYNLDVSGIINASNDIRINGNSILGGMWTPIATGVHYTNGNFNVGIGTGNEPLLRKLEVNGNVLLMASSTDAVNGFCFSNDGSLPDRRGITLGDDPDGSMNFFINSWQNEERFNFMLRDGQTTNTTFLMTLTGEGKLGLGTNDPSGFNGNASLNEKLVHLSGTSPAIRLENTGSAGNESSDVVFSSHNGMGRIISDKGLALFIGATNVQTPDNVFSIVKNHQDFSSPIPNADYLFKITNDGKLFAHSMKVTIGAFPDYVFKDDYDLMPLTELKNYIDQNNKLPGIPSANEIIESGMDVGSIVVMQMEKIEELTLYIIELENKINSIQQKLNK